MLLLIPPTVLDYWPFNFNSSRGEGEY